MRNIFLFLTAIFILNSCGGKDDPIGLNDISIAPNGSNKVIKKVKVKENGLASYDITYTWNTGRLLSVTTSNNSFTYTIEYSGNLISKIVHNSGQGPQMELSTSNLSYSNGKLNLVEGVIITGSSAAKNFKTTYTYVQDKLSFVKTQYFQPGSTTIVTDTKSTLYEYSGLNISKSNTGYDFAGTLYSTITTFSNYDANPNPLVKLPPAFTLATANAEKNSFGALALSPNNFKLINTQLVGSTIAEDVTYTYSSDGYVVKSVRPSVTYEYEYINF